MPIGNNELSGLLGFGTGMFQGITSGMNRKQDLMAELEKERRRQAMQEQQMRLRQAQTDVNASDIPVSDRPMTVDALGRDLNERTPDQSHIEQLLSGKGNEISSPTGIQEKDWGPNVENLSWLQGVTEPKDRQAAMESAIMQEKSPLSGELILEKAKRRGTLGGGGLFHVSPQQTIADKAYENWKIDVPAGRIVSSADKAQARFMLAKQILAYAKRENVSMDVNRAADLAEAKIPETPMFPNEKFK